MPRLVDAHTHIQFHAFKEDRDEVIDRALAEDIWVVNVGTQFDTSEGAIKIAEEHDEGVYATVGLHPIHTTLSYHDKKELGNGEAAKAFTSRGEDFDYSLYRELARNKKVVAIGECGLDYYRLDKETKDKQVEVFEKQIKLAHEVEKPLMIHCRQAFPDLIKILKTNHYKLKTNYPGITHFFTGSVDDAKKLKDLGFYFSFGGVVTFARDYDDVIKEIGLDRIVLETDAPYVAPVPYRGKRNEPSYITHTAKKIAELLSKTYEEVAEKTTKNAREIFKI